MAKRKPMTPRRRATLDAVKVLKAMSGGVDIDTATALAVPLVQSKPTKETRRRRTNAKRLALKELRTHKTPLKALEATRKPRAVAHKIAPTSLHGARIKRAEALLQKRAKGGKPRKLTQEERRALKTYTARQVLNPATDKLYFKRLEILDTSYTTPHSNDVEKIIEDARYMTPGAIAKKYGLQKLRKAGTEPPDVWQKFTDCSDIENTAIEYDRLRAARSTISSREYEEGSNGPAKGHTDGGFMYENDYLEDDLTLFDLKPGRFDSVKAMREKIVADYFGDMYIYVHQDSTGRGRVLLRNEYENARTLASDWVDSLLYIPLGAD